MLPGNCIDVVLVCCPSLAMKETHLFRSFSYFWTIRSSTTETTLGCLRTLHQSTCCFYRQAVYFSQETMSVPHGSCVKRKKVISFTLASREVHGANRTTLKLYDLKRQESDRMSPAVFFLWTWGYWTTSFCNFYFYKWSKGSVTGAR